MQPKDVLMFAAVAMLVGTIASMTTTSGAFATQITENSSNSNDNSNSSSDDCQDNNSAGDNADSATAATSDNDNAATNDDADEQGDNDVNDQEDTDTGNEDTGEANDDEEQNDGATASTSANDNAADATDQFPLPKFDPCNYSNDGIVDNPYFTLTPGTTFTYEGETEDGTEKNVVIVTDETKEILGINATVVWDRVWLEDELIEETFDWYAQDKEGNVWYLGEDSKEYENGEVVSTEGSWEAGVDGAKPGIIMEADPQVGDQYRQEYYPGHAEDQAEVVSLNEEVTVPFGTFTDCLQTRDSTPLEPTTGDEDKYYCTDVGGVVLEVAIESGERSELIDFNQSGDTASPPDNDNAATNNDADEQGDNDVNDQEDTDTGNEDTGEANDQE
jgi:hypothetical protein